MKLYPAIDLSNKQAVRLYKGDYNQSTIYGDAVNMAKKWQSLGATFLHIVDLDAAKSGESANLDIVKAIIDNTGIDVELGGGIRDIKKIEYVLSLGVKRVILGSAALKNKAFLVEALNKFGNEKIVVGVDALNFTVRTDGWLIDSNIDALEFAKELESIGVKYVIFTDISKDGTLTGINKEQTKKLIDNTNLSIIASGGVRDIKDLEKANEIGAYGIIIGKALYENTIDLKKAIKEYE